MARSAERLAEWTRGERRTSYASCEFVESINGLIAAWVLRNSAVLRVSDNGDAVHELAANPKPLLLLIMTLLLLLLLLLMVLVVLL